MKTPGLGWSSPVIVGGAVYLTTAVPDGDGLSLRALALDAATGSLLWDQEVRAVEKRADDSLKIATPVRRP
ncbi:MAG: hypothetical protein U0992_03775 [Planctomycetaceae bacterium]